MFKKTVLLMSVCLTLAACATDKPHVVQATSETAPIRLTAGMATQVEMPHDMRVRSVVVGNPALLTADRDEDVVNLVPKEASGETNMIVRAADESGEVKVYQYRIIVQGQ